MKNKITKDQIVKALNDCLEVNEEIGDEPVSFLSVVVSRDIKTGHIRSTVTNVCGDEVSSEIKDKFSENMHSLADTMKKAFRNNIVRHHGRF